MEDDDKSRALGWAVVLILIAVSGFGWSSYLKTNAELKELRSDFVECERDNTQLTLQLSKSEMECIKGQVEGHELFLSCMEKIIEDAERASKEIERKRNLEKKIRDKRKWSSKPKTKTKQPVDRTGGGK